MEKTHDLDTFLQSMPDFNNRYNCISYNTCPFAFSSLHRLNIYKNQQYNKFNF